MPLGDFLPTKPKRWKELCVLGGLAMAAHYAYPILNQKSLNGDVAVVTGAGSGIGRLMAIRLAKEGCKLALWDINKEAVEKVAEEIRALGVTAKTYVCDVSDRHAVYASAKVVEEDFGQVDIIINNAGIVNGKKLLEADDRRIELTIKINTLALMWVTKAFLPGMLQRDHGHIVNIASSAGRVGVPGMTDYCASKYGAVGFDESLRLELRKLGSKVKTTCVCPSYINTGMFDGVKIQPRYKFLNGLVNTLLPILEPSYVADTVIDAVKQNQALLVTPRMAYSTGLLKAVLPVAAFDQVMDDLGLASSMDDFKQTRVEN